MDFRQFVGGTLKLTISAMAKLAGAAQAYAKDEIRKIDNYEKNNSNLSSEQIEKLEQKRKEAEKVVKQAPKIEAKAKQTLNKMQANNVSNNSETGSK